MVRETRHLWVGNLPHTIREERILDHFKRYGKVQSVKILPKKEDDSGGACATVAFIDIKSAAKAHNADNKIEDRTLKTDYYEPPASSTATSAIYIHERDDALVRNPPASYSTPRTPRYGLSEERNYERPGHYYGDREPYLRRPLGMGYHDEDNYQGRAKSRDRYSRSNSGNTYTEGTDRNQNHFRSHNTRQHFEQQRYPVGEQYNDERDPAATTPRLNRRTNNNIATPVVASVASPTTTRSESRPRRTKRRSRSPSRTPSGSRSSSGSRSRSRSSSDSRSSSSSSKVRATSSDSSGRSRSPSKSRSPAASYASQNNAKGSRLDRPSSAIANPSSTVSYLPSAVNTSAINCTSNNTQGSTPTQGCSLDSSQNNCDKEEKRPLGICVRNLPVRSTDTSLKDGLFHEYKKHGKVTMVKVIGQGTDRYAVVCFKKPEDVEKALEVSKDKLFFGCKIEVTAHEGLDAEDNEFRPLEAELDEYHPKATRTLFIGNLEKDITTAELRKHFDQFGEIIEIDIKKQGSATSYAFIQYSDIASVVKAMRKLDGENLGANRIKLGFGKSMPTNCVWLDGVSEKVTESFLRRHINTRLHSPNYIAIDREKGHALVFFENVDCAQMAVSEMRGRILQGKKLQVDFASRECQTTFFEKLEMTGQLPPEVNRPIERDRRDRRSNDFEVLRTDDRETRVGFENRSYPRYEGQARVNRGNFRGNQRTGFPGRGRGQNFPRYEVYHDEFGERRHRYRDENETTFIDGKMDIIKYADNPDCPGRKRNKLRNSISDQESHHSQSPPRSRHQSRSTSPVSKERKSLKDRLHHRIKSPGSHNSSLVNSPCRDTLLDDLETNCEYRDSRSKSSDAKMDDIIADFSYTSPRSSSEKEGSEKMLSKSECDSFRSRSSLDAESADESGLNIEQLGQLERKKRLLASSNVKSAKDTIISSKSGSEKIKPKNSTSHNSLKSSKGNCLSEASIEELKSELENINLQYECAKEKYQNDCANSELKYLKKRQVQILHLLDQAHESVNSSDNDCSVDAEGQSRKKHRSSSTCLDSNSVCENDIKSHTKDECGPKMCKSSMKDPSILTKFKKTENVEDSNCVSLSLDSFSFRKHLDPRKGFDQHSVSLVSSLQKSRRISVDSDSCLPNIHGTNETFLCVPSSVSADLPWKKQSSSLSDVNFSENENDSSIPLPHFKPKQESDLDDEIVNKKSHLSNSHSLDLPKGFMSLRAFADGMPCHDIKRERDISPLSLPLPKFAASLRSPKSSPSILTSPKSTTAHSPRAGHSPSYASSKSIRIPDLLHDITTDKKVKDIVPEDKVNGANTSPVDSALVYESQVNNDTSESTPSVEPIQSPKSNCDKIKECLSSSESDYSPSSSPNHPSIADRIKALDEIFNVWNGKKNSSTALPEGAPSVAQDSTSKCTMKRSRYSYIAETRKEPSDIVKSLLARSTIFDQDSKRLQHIDEKYEPLNIKMDLSPKVKPTFRTKAAAKEFSTPITPTIQSFSQSLLVKSPSTVMVAQGIMSPPSTPQSATSSIVSPVTPMPQYTQLPPSVFTPLSPRSTSFSLSSTLIKTESINSIDKDITEQILKSPQVFNSVKVKADPNFHANSAALATSLKSSPLTCPAETPSHGSVVTSLTIKKEPASPTEADTQNVCNMEPEIKTIKKEVTDSTCIPIKKENTVISVTKDHSHFNSIDQDKKEFCDSKDPRLSFSEEGIQWRENGCKEEIKVNVDSSAKSYSCPEIPESSLIPAAKKRVSSIDSNESDSSKSLKSLESSRDSQETNWGKQERISEPELKKPKSTKNAREKSISPPPIHQLSKKSDKKEKSSKTDRTKSAKSTPVNSTEKVRHESKCNKGDYKEKSKEHKNSKEEKRSKSKDLKDFGTKNEGRTKPPERRNSEKDNKISNNSNNPSNNKPKKDTTNKTEKSSEKKQSEKKSKSNKFDFSAFMDDEPVYFSMYDKVKARSSKSQTLKHQTTSDLESVRQKFSKLKQSRAKREEKSKSVDHDSDKDSDSSHHSSESDSETKPVKVKQPRKRKLVIESSSDDEIPSQEVNSQSIKVEKDFQSDSATDSDFDYNVTHRQTANKSRRKKTELLDSDSSDSDSNFPSKSQQTGKKKSTNNRSKGRLEKGKKIIKSDQDMSDIDTSKNQKSRDKDKSKKVKKDKEPKVELEIMDCDLPKRFSEDIKNKKKLSKDTKSESDLSPVQKKFKSDHSTKEKGTMVKDKKVESSNEKVQSSEETEKHKPYTKKRKKSKKMCRNKDKRASDKVLDDTSRKQMEESDTKSSLPVLLSPKPSSPLPDKQLSPPCLQAGVLSDNDFKSDFSDFEYENQPTEEVDNSRDMWKHLDTKSDTNSEKSSKCKKENISKPEPASIHSPEQDSSLPSFFDKLSDITDSETGREAIDFTHDVTSGTTKHMSFSVKKEKDAFVSTSPHKSKHDKREDQNISKQDSVKYSDNYSSPSKEERKRKKSKKQYKERRKKMKDDVHSGKDEIIDSASVSSPKASIFKTVGGDEDSRLSDIRLDEEIAEEARRLEQELLAGSEETSTFGDDGPAKREEKLLERRFEEEAAKETRRLEAELLSTGRDSWHMKEKEYDSEPNSGDICDDKHVSEMESMIVKEENIFAGLELHSSVAESSQNDTDIFLSGHSESDPYKIDDKDVTTEIEDQRKIEDDLAVSALLQEMHCGEIPAPELTKESDYLEMEAHPDDTMNYLLPDDGENSLHIADSSPDNQGNESQEAKLESEDIVLSPSSNSEPPPALEISNVEESVLMKIDNENQASDSLKIEHSVKNQIDDHKSYQYHDENSLELCESKPPIIDLPNIQEKPESHENQLSPKSDLTSIHKKRSNDKPFRIPSKPEAINNEDTDDECSSDLTENQLTHFEDITNDTADSKDDDNPPILLPVESPPNLIPVTNSKEQMEPLDKVTIDDNHCLDRIIGKATTSDENIFSNVDLDKQIGDIINSITEKSKQLDDNDSFRMSGSRNMADLTGHNINDPLGLSNSANLFDPPKAEEPNNSRDFNSEDVLKPSEKEVRNTDPSNIPVSFPEEPTNKFQHPENQNNCILEPSILNYSQILSNSNCETSVIQSTQKIDNDAVTISITEKTNLPNIDQFQENQNNISNNTHTSSDSFILELFGSKSAESFKVEPDLASCDKKKSTEFEMNSESKSKIPENDLSTLDFGPQREIKPLFEIPEVNEQNEATEFNQEIFEGPSDQNKEEQAPRLLSFSSEHLFSDNSSAKKEENLNVTENSENIDRNSIKENRDAKLDDNPSKSETDDNFLEYSSIDLHSNKEIEFEKKCEEAKEEENLNIEESLENKIRPADAESVCSDTTDITIPETKMEQESSQIPLIEEQVQEDVCPVEETEINVKPKIERPRRGRRPKTRRYVESSAQKSEPVIEAQVTPPVNMRITRRSGGRPTSSERNLRSLRKDTSETLILRDINDSKQSSAEIPEIIEVKKDDEISEVSINEPFETESSTTSINSRTDNEPKLPEKSSIKSEEPRKRRGRRKKNSGDHSSDKMEPKFEEHESSKDVNRPKESRLLLSLSEREQNKNEREQNKKESTVVDVYEFIESEDEGNTKFESIKERQENIRSNVSDSKHDNKVFDSVFEKKESNPEEPKSKTICGDDKDIVFKEYHVATKETVGKDHHVISKDHHVSSKETSSKGHHSTSKETAKETNSKEQPRKHSKLHMVIKFFPKDGDTGTAEVIKTSEAIEVSKYESSKPERNSSSKHDSVPEVPHNGPTTRKSTRLMNQSLSTKNNYDKTIEDVVKSNSKSNANNSSHSESLPTRVTRRSRSSRRSEESLPAPSESSNDTIEDKNKNEPVFFIPDNKEIPETKRNASNHSVDSSRASDFAASEFEKNSSKHSLRGYRMRNNKLESCKDVSHSGIPGDQDSHRKESVPYSSADDKFDALQKEHLETKINSKETRSSVPENPPMPSLVLKVEIPRVNLQAVTNICTKPEKEDDSDSGSNRSSPAVHNDTKLSSTKTSDSFPETPNSSSSSDKNMSVLVSDTSIIPSSKNIKASVPETSNTSSVIQESSKVSQPDDSQISTRTRNRRSRINNPPPLPPPPPPPLPAVTVTSSPVQTNVTTSSSDTSSKLKTVPIKKAAYNAAVPVIPVTNTVVSTATTANTNNESISVTSSSRILITQNQPPVITSLGLPVTTAVTQSPIIEKKEDVKPSGLPKISQGQSSVKAIVTPVVTQMPPVKPLPSNVQTKCSTNTTSTSSSVLMATELPVVNSSANIPPTSVTEHISSVNVKPVSLHPPLTSEQSNIPHEAHTTPDTSSWANSKVPSNRITEAHPPVGTIQTNSINNPVFTTKSESRSSKASHISKNSQFNQQSAFPLNYELSNTHNMPVVPELTQLMQQENFSSVVGLRQLQERMQGQVVRPATPVACTLPPDIAHRLGQTSPHTPTPPVTSANLSSEIHSPLHLRPSQSPLIVHPPSLHTEASFLNRFIAASPLNPYSIHPDIRVPQDPQVRIMGMSPQYTFPLPLNAAVPTNAFGQPTDRLQSSVLDAKPENQKMVNDLSKIVQESRGADDKAHHSVKSGRSKKEDKDKVIHSDRDDHESRYIPAHEKIPSTSAVTHTLCNTAPYSSIHPLSQCLTVSPNERTDSPIIANSYAAGQRPPIPISGQVDDHKTESLSLPSHFKGDTQEIKPPVAHQSSMSYHPGVLSSAGHIDGRSSNPAHSPNSHIYKKDSTHSQQISSLHNPATDKRVNSEHSKRVVHARTHVQGSSISPAPVGMPPPAQSPWNISHSSIAQSPHVILSTNEQSSHRVNPHIISQRGSEVPVHVPPPAHTMPQSSNVPRTLPQTPPHASQVPTHDAYILRRYPVMWQGLLALKNAQASVQMHFVSGNPIIARASLPPIVDGEAAPVRISQRMRLDQQQLDGVFRKIQLVEEHCILMALPCGKDQEDLVQQSNNIQTEFINYLKSKNAAGIVNAAAPGTQQPAFVIHIFPSCGFITENLNRTAPSLLRLVNQISHLVIVIATV